MKHALRLFRTREHLSLQALASKVGTTRASLSRIEKGLQTPSLDLMFKLVEATGGEVTPHDFASAPLAQNPNGQDGAAT